MDYFDSDFKKIIACPMCNENKTDFLYEISTGGSDDFEGRWFDRTVKAIRCKSCGFVFSDEILNDSGKNKFWKNYSSRCHEHDTEAIQKRNKMYQIEYDFISQFLGNKPPRILDVGCGEGGFLDCFVGARCTGVELGEEAANKASLKYKVYQGEFPIIDFKEKFDLVIFRGTLQYFDEPQKYLMKADEVLADGGLLYITSTPNADGFCAKLFKEYFSFAVCAVAGNGFSPYVLNNFFLGLNYELCAEKYFYENTPYCNVEEDIKKIAMAIEKRERGEEIKFCSPAFWGNMMSLVYRKKC